MNGRSAFAAFMCPTTPLQDVPLDLTPTSGTPSTALPGGVPITPILTPNTWASIEQVFKDFASTPQAETLNGDDSSGTARSVSSTAVVPTVVEALHNEDHHHQAENLSLKKQFAVPGFDRMYAMPQPQAQVVLSVAPSKLKVEKPAIVAATTTTTDALVMRHASHSQLPKRKVSTSTIDDDGSEINKATVRRERNRMAAARCRQRRVDLTQSLFEECNALKAEKAEILEQLLQVKQQKEHLEFILQAHETLCKVKLMAPEVTTASALFASDIGREDALRPQAAASLSANSGAAKRPSSLLFAQKVDNMPLKKKIV